MEYPGQRFPWQLDWNLLRTFIVIVEQRSITGAANALGVTQPSVSASLKRLEDALQVRLIDRGSRHFRVTQAGLQLQEQAGQIFGAITELPHALQARSETLSGTLTLAMASHVVSPHFDAVLERFARSHPAVDFALPVMASDEVMAWVRQGRAIAGLCLTTGSTAGLDCQPLYHEYFALFCGRGHPAYGRQTIAPDEWASYTSVCFQTETRDGSLRRVREMRDKIGLSIHPRGMSSSLHEVRRMIAAGLGIGALPVHVAAEDLRRGDLWQIDAPEPPARIAVHIVSRQGARHGAAAQAFLTAPHRMRSDTPAAELDYRPAGRTA